MADHNYGGEGTFSRLFARLKTLLGGYAKKSGDTMTGALVAQSNTDYTTRQVRNIITVADGDDIPATQPGDIIFIREA